MTTEFQQVEKLLRDLPANLEKSGARKATRSAAKVVLDDAIALAPEDTGALVQSLKVRARKRSRRNRGTVGHSVVTSEQTLKNETYYAAFVELGTKFKEADPFLRPALWSNEAKVERTFIFELKKWLETEAAKPVKEFPSFEEVA